MYDYEKSLNDLEEIISSQKKFNSFFYATKESCVQNLLHQSLNCHSISIVDLKKKNNTIHILDHKTICEIHPLYSTYLPVQLSFISQSERNSAFQEYLDLLKIDASQVEEIILSKRKNTTKLIISHYKEWKNLELNHLRFYNFSLVIDNICLFLTNSIKNKNLSISNQEDLMNWYQKLKFEINQIIYDLLKNYNLEVEDCKPAIKENYLRIDYIIFLIDKLEKLQQNIEKRYQNCINRLFDISSNFMHENLEMIQHKIMLIEKQLHISTLSKDLKEILFNVFMEFKEKSLNSTVSFNRFNYMQTFTSHFENWINSMEHSNELNDKKMIEFLIEMNFNHFKFLEWISTNMFKIADGIENNRSRYRFFIKQLTLYSHFPIRVRSSYNEVGTDLRSYFSIIIQHELNYSDFQVIKAEKIKKENGSENKPNSRLKLNNNASIFILLFRYLNQNGMFENATPTAISEFISEHFYTSNTDKFTKLSLRNKYYKNDHEQKKELQILLQNIIADLKKD